MSSNSPYRTCGQCANWENGCCTSAGEALVSLGYPLVTVRPRATARAVTCPSFEWSEAAEADEEVAREQARGDRMEWLRGRLTAEEAKIRRV